MNIDIASEDLLRGHFYSLMARMLAKPPDKPLFELLKEIPEKAPPGGEATAAWQELRKAVIWTDLFSESAEYQRLFYSIRGKRIIPYASWYETGRLSGPPLVKIRKDLNRLGIARASGVSEPEDHLAALCETMALLCGSVHYSADEGIHFYQCHLTGWIDRFFSDLKNMAQTPFYKAVGNLGSIFFRMEGTYLDLESKSIENLFQTENMSA